MKIKNLYNMEAVRAFLDSGKQQGFADAYAGTVLARNLTAVDPTLFEKKFPELAFVNSGIVANNTGGYARRIQSLRIKELGGFKTAGDTSGNKGKISISAEDSYLNVLVREGESDWSDDEIKEGELQNINLPERYLKAHNSLYMREVDEIGLIGITGGPDTGLLNHAGFTSGSAGNTVDTLTAQDLYDEFADLINAQWAAVNNTPEYKANRVMTPVYVVNKMQSTMMNTAAGSSSVLRALQDNFPDVQIIGTPRADDAVSAGVSATVAYSNNGESMIMRIPVPLTVGEILKVSSFHFHVESKYRIAGLDVLENTAGRILTGL
jgi:hypothetical protein